MSLYLFDVFGNASIGIYCLANDRIAILPPQVPEPKREKFAEWMNVKVVATTIGKSLINGALACSNSNGVILPYFVADDEIDAIKSVVSDINIAVMDTKRTAYGNMVLANDKGAIVDSRLESDVIAKISDNLGVEVVRGDIAGLPYVGSLATATNKGVLAHPLIKENEQKILSDVLKVPVDLGTVNCGIPYVATGLIGNIYGAVAGLLTTGPEMFIIGQALDVVE
ncbi:MAG: translation initiation factor IF-6 [Candidatus Bathyarchaeota archaeon]|nr:translation initiation factor IF-6 [Candidatus Bathyarchaeum tardum]WGM89351.1 MAG: translation initiation factor IF-6 [Candidatus Bathyarchaeum tardum]WNZ28375.1 MAG: translation initiation factor IF-6 [Candidatus Bathyarchaeota archaeon]